MERSNNVTASCYCNSFFHKDYLCCTSKFSKTLGYQPNKCHFSKLLLPGASFNLHRQLFSFLKLYCKFYIHKPYSLLALLLALWLFPSSWLLKRAALCALTLESFTQWCQRVTFKYFWGIEQNAKAAEYFLTMWKLLPASLHHSCGNSIQRRCVQKYITVAPMYDHETIEEE